MPPKLSAKQMFWWGSMLAITATVVHSLAQPTLWLYSSELQAAFLRTFGVFLTAILALAQMGGVALVAGAFVVRSLDR